MKLYDGVNMLRQYLDNNGEFATAMSLSDYVCYEDCILRFKGNRNGHILDVHELAQLMKIPYNTLRRNIGSLMKKGILCTSKIGNRYNPDEVLDVIVVNPDIYLRGMDINKTVKGLFEKSGWNEYSQKTLRESNSEK